MKDRKLPQVLLGEFSGKSRCLPDLKRHGFGRMWSSYGPDWSYEGEPWGFDNGAWSAFAQGEDFPSDKFVRRMSRARNVETQSPILAALPDVVGCGMATLAQSEQWLSSGELVPSWPWFLVAQDGMCPVRALRLIKAYNVSGIFLGGTDEFKKQSAFWCHFAHTHSIGFHYGRCNRETWLRDAIRIGADSIDTTRPVRAAHSGEYSRYMRWVQIATGQDRHVDLPWLSVGVTVQVVRDTDGAVGTHGVIEAVFNSGRVQVRIDGHGIRNLSSDDVRATECQ